MKTLFLGIRFLQLVAIITVSNFISVQRLYAQDLVNFTPAKLDVKVIKTTLDKLSEKYKIKNESLSGKDKKDYKEIYDMQWTGMKHLFENEELFMVKYAQDFLNGLKNEIVAANPALKNYPIEIFFSRSHIPNAYYIGEGIIIINMGLFYRLNNEAEVVFVLCHELSHLYLDHITKRIDKIISTTSSEAYQDELKKIKKSEYGKRQMLENLTKGMSFDFSRHSRYNESEADSMAIEFMRNTNYSIDASLSTLRILNTIDKDTLPVEQLLKQHFNSKEFPFQPRWTAKEEGLLGGHASLKKNVELQDSLKTHPDCAKRIKMLEPLILKYKKANTGLTKNESVYQLLVDNFKYEAIEFCIEDSNYSRALYLTLDLLQQKPADPYLVTAVGRVFNGFFAAQKNHELSKFTQMPNPGYTEPYNLLLQFIQNLYKDDYASISYHFLKQYHPAYAKFPLYKSVYEKSIQLALR